MVSTAQIWSESGRQLFQELRNGESLWGPRSGSWGSGSVLERRTEKDSW